MHMRITSARVPGTALGTLDLGQVPGHAPGQVIVKCRGMSLAQKIDVRLRIIVGGASVAPVGVQGGRTDLGHGRLFPLGMIDCA